MKNNLLIKFDLGGIGYGKNGYRTVNLISGVDIQKDILELDDYCKDNSVDEFFMSHTFEHILSIKREKFVKKLLTKLKKGGKLIIIQTDIKKVLKLYCKGILDFYCLRDIILTPMDRQIKMYKITRKNLQQHQGCWGAGELKKELLYYGFSKVELFDVRKWNFDCNSFFPFQKNEKYFGIKIPNLGIIATK